MGNNKLKTKVFLISAGILLLIMLALTISTSWIVILYYCTRERGG